MHELEAIEGIRALCRSTFAGRCRTETYFNPDGTVHSMGVYAPGADKGTALALVQERLGVEKEQTMVIGDNRSDLAMFAYAGVCVAMGNALEEVKRQASLLAPSNDDEGVAWALELVVFRGLSGPRGRR